jgi:hypothetical protein
LEPGVDPTMPELLVPAKNPAASPSPRLMKHLGPICDSAIVEEDVIEEGGRDCEWLRVGPCRVGWYVRCAFTPSAGMFRLGKIFRGKAELIVMSNVGIALNHSTTLVKSRDYSTHVGPHLQ